MKLTRARWLPVGRDRRTAVALAIGVNLLLLLGYLWSRPGQTTTIRVEALQSSFRASVDGHLVSGGLLEAPGAGGIELRLTAGEWLPSLPGPSGIDWIEVRDARTRDLIFRDDFDDLSQWSDVSPRVHARDGFLSVDRGATDVTLRTGDDTWRDYTVEVKARNIQDVAIRMRTSDQGGALFRARPFHNHDQNFQLLAADGSLTTEVLGPPLQLDRSESARLLVATLLKPYPYFVVALLIASLVVALLRFLPAPRVRTFHVDEGRVGRMVAAAGAVWALAFGLFVMLRWTDRMPHVPDSVAYLFQAKILGTGHVAASPPPVAESFTFFSPPMMWTEDGHWASVFPWAHSVVLMPGVLIGAPWIVPPLVGAACIGLLYLAGATLFDARTAVMSVLLMATSPFFLLTESDFMSHNTATMFLLAAISLSLFDGNRGVWAAVAGGICFGLLFNTRPLTAVALIPAFTIGWLLLLRQENFGRTALFRLGAFAVGAGAMFGAYLLYNLGTTGDAMSSGYQASGQGDIGFSDGHSFALGIQNIQTLAALFVAVLNGWPAYVGLGFAMLPFALGSRDVRDWLLLLAILCMTTAYALYPGTGIMHGPRFWYEATPLAMLLSARGIARLALVLGQIRVGRPTASTSASAWYSHALVYGVVAALIGGSLYGWLLGRHAGWQAGNSPAEASDLQRFNGADDRLVVLIDNPALDNALVLVEPCPSWQCYGTVFWMNSPSLDGRVVIAKRVDEEFLSLLKAFPDRRVYLADYNKATLMPFGGSPPTQRRVRLPNDVLDAAPTAGQILASLGDSP